MSFRPTIAVYINNELCDISYCRNWSEESLFIECAALIAFYGNCRTRKAFLKKRYPDVRPSRFDDPDSAWSKEGLEFLSECSEMYVSVDLTEKCIYTGSRENRMHYCQPGQTYSWQQFRKAFCPDARDMKYYGIRYRKKYEELCSIRYADFSKHMADILNYYITDLSDTDLCMIRQMFHTESDIRYHVSALTDSFIKTSQEAEIFRS